MKERMKTVRHLLFAVCTVVGAATAAAQIYYPVVNDVSLPDSAVCVEAGDTLVCFEEPTRAVLRHAAHAAAMADHLSEHRTGFQQAGHPRLVFSQRENRFSFAVGGYVALRTSYDFDGSPSAIDFVTSAIPVPGDYASRQRLSMDASTSLVYLRGIINTQALGRVVVYVSTDFRGGAEWSYTPALREAYVSFKGLTFGRDVTTFCDLAAGPTTIDFQGPNSYNFNFATLIRYERSFARDRFTFGVAAEMPDVSGTCGDDFEPIPQRMPDFPAYIQYAWGPRRNSHLRLTGVVRNLYMYNTLAESSTSLFGWGVQASTYIETTPVLTLYGSGVYGEGIANYIQDLSGLGYDFTPDPQNPARVQTLPVWGWYGAARIGVIPQRLFLSAGYSEAHIQHKNGFYADNQYRNGQYVFANVFYNLTPRCILAVEYLYGSRENMNGLKNHANRASMQIQYNF